MKKNNGGKMKVKWFVTISVVPLHEGGYELDYEHQESFNSDIQLSMIQAYDFNKIIMAMTNEAAINQMAAKEAKND
jgi:hypothetical protein